MTYRVIIINEECEELIKNEEIEEEIVDAIIEMIDNDEIPENYEECAEVCETLSSMLKEAGVEDSDDHDTMLSELENMKLVRVED